MCFLWNNPWSVCQSIFHGSASKLHILHKSECFAHWIFAYRRCDKHYNVQFMKSRENYAASFDAGLSKSITFNGKQNRHLCHYAEIMREWWKEWWKTILFDSGPSTKDDFNLRWKESSKCNCVLFTGNMACTPYKEDFLPLSNKVNKQRYIYLLDDGMMTPTGTNPKPCQ